MKELKGIGVSTGIAIAKVHNLQKFSYEVSIEQTKQKEKAHKNLEATINSCYEETLELIDELVLQGQKKEADIFKAHSQILKDPEYIGKMKALIDEKSYTALSAIHETSMEYIRIFEQMENQYLKERAVDIRDIRKRLLKKQLGFEDSKMPTDAKVIVVAEELTPSETAKLDLNQVIGFVTSVGGETSHTAIMAKSLGLPGIVGANNILEFAKDGEMMIINGQSGDIIVNPNNETINNYQEKRKKLILLKEKLTSYTGKKTISKDGKSIELSANIGKLEDVNRILSHDAEGIGLFRTEFLYMESKDFPTENAQFEVYRKVIEKMKNKNVIIRTLDIGGDKSLSYYDFPKEMNPFLGYRAIRFCLDHEELFRTQLRAILRASAYGKIHIMFPMISSVKELKQSILILEEEKSKLLDEGIAFNNDLPIGLMIEVPSAAIIADQLAKYVDFFSIGTNDLIQYTVAVDRMNENLKDLYTPYNPAVLRLIHNVINKAHEAGIWVGMCGEVAGNPRLIPILLGMGLDEFSMASSSILRARYIINSLDKRELRQYIKKIIQAETAKEVNSIIDDFIDQQSIDSMYFQ